MTNIGNLELTEFVFYFVSGDVLIFSFEEDATPNKWATDSLSCLSLE